MVDQSEALAVSTRLTDRVYYTLYKTMKIIQWKKCFFKILPDLGKVRLKTVPCLEVGESMLAGCGLEEVGSRLGHIDSKKVRNRSGVIWYGKRKDDRDVLI